MKLARTDLLVMLAALLLGATIGYAQLHLFTSELNPNLVTQPYLISKGFVLYQNLGDQKPPLLILLVAWLMPFFNGDAVTVARTIQFSITLLLVFLSITWVYRRSGLWSAIFCALFMLAWSNFMGLWATAYYDLVLSPFFLLLFMLMVWTEPARHYFKALCAGLLIGIALLIKQQALILVPIYIAGIFVELASHRLPVNKVASKIMVFIINLLFPVALFLLASHYQSGSIEDFFFWNITLLFQNSFASVGALIIPPAQLFKTMQILILLVPFCAIIFLPDLGLPVSRATRLWLLVFLVVAAFFQYPRFSSRHWAVAFPFAAIISGIACADIIHLIKSKRAYWILALLLIAPAWWVDRAVNQYVQAWNNPDEVIREYSDLFDLAEELESRLPGSGSIAIFPMDESNANLYYILQREPPHFFIYHYPWFMNNAVIKQRWIEALENEQTPVLLNFPHIWDVDTLAPELIAYIDQNYHIADTLQWNGRIIQILLRKTSS